MRKLSVLLLALCLVSVWVAGAGAQTMQANSRAWIGVNVQTLDRTLARNKNISVAEGALITRVVPGSPADRAGLQVNDVIVRFEGNRVNEAGDVVHVADRYNPGDRVAITVMRGNQQLQMPLTFGDIRDAESNRSGGNETYNRYPTDNSQNQHGDADQPANRDQSSNRDNQDNQTYGRGSNRGSYGNGTQGPFIGVRLEELTNQMADYFGVSRGQGALVAEVVSGSPAERAGLRAGDVIIMVDNQPIRGAADVQQLVQSQNVGSSLPIQVMRNRRTVTYNIRLTNWNEQQDRYGSGTGTSDQGYSGRGSSMGSSQDTQENQVLRQEVDDLRQQVEDLQQQVQDLQRKVQP